MTKFANIAAALALTLACCGGVLAAPANDCLQLEDVDLKIGACTLVIQGRFMGLEKSRAFNLSLIHI